MSETAQVSGKTSADALSAQDETLVADLLAERDRRIWPKKCLESERKFGSRTARLYPLIGSHGGVETPQGQGTLFNAFDSGCQVLLTRGRNTGRDSNKKPYKPLKDFAVEDVMPAKLRGQRK